MTTSYQSKWFPIQKLRIQELAQTKGQLISKAIYGLLTSPKKRMDEFVLFVFLLFTANKSNSSVRFLGESTACQSAFRFYLTFRKFLMYVCKKMSEHISVI